MFKPLALVSASLLLVSVSVWAKTPGDSAADMTPAGPPQLFQIATKCDMQRLKGIERHLTGDQKQFVRYDFTLFLRFKDKSVVTAEITSNHRMPKSVRQCIIKQYLASPSFKARANGLVPIHVAFPVLVTPKKHQ